MTLDMQETTEVRLDALNSKFVTAVGSDLSGGLSSRGLVYRWECANEGENAKIAMQNYCE